MSQLSHAQFPLRRHPDLLVDHRRARSAAVAEPRGANVESRDRLRWPASFRNGGRNQIGIPGRIASEFAGYSKKAVLTETSKLDLRIPRGREGTFDPKLIARYQRRLVSGLQVPRRWEVDFERARQAASRWAA